MSEEMKEEFIKNEEAEPSPAPAEDKNTIMDIITSCSGKDAQGQCKASVGLFYEIVTEDGKEKKTVETVAVDRPIINIHKNLHHVFVDLKFASYLDVDLNLMNKLLTRAFNAQNSYIPGHSDVPLVTMSVIPHEYGGRFYLLMTDPIFWALTSETPDGRLDTLRFVFAEDDFYIMAASDETVKELQDAIEAEADAERRKEEFYAEKEAERTRQMYGEK